MKASLRDYSHYTKKKVNRNGTEVAAKEKTALVARNTLWLRDIMKYGENGEHVN